MACLPVTVVEKERQSVQEARFDPIIHTAHALANGDRPRGDPLAGIEQIHDRVVPTRGKVAAAGIECGSDAAAHMGGKVLAQHERGDVKDADGVLRHVCKNHAVARMVEHRG
jgi:hypothetical protein